MTLHELRENLAFLYDVDTPTELSMYILMQNGEIKFANLEEAARQSLKRKFLEYLQEKIVANDEVNYSPLTEYTDRKNTVCYYDLEELPEGLEAMGNVLENEEQEEFSAADDGFNNIEAFVFLIGNENNKVALYKKHHWLSVIKQDAKFLSFGKSDTGLVQIKDDILKVSERFEFMQLGQSVIVLSTKTLENSFGYQGILQAAARDKFDLICDAELIENIHELEELIVEKKFAKKLVAVKASTPVLALPFERIRDFILNHPKLRRRIKFNEANDRISFHTRTSKELFLDLLGDSYLKSELTELLYHSSIKDSLTNEEEQDEE